MAFEFVVENRSTNLRLRSEVEKKANFQWGGLQVVRDLLLMDLFEILHQRDAVFLQRQSTRIKDSDFIRTKS